MSNTILLELDPCVVDLQLSYRLQLGLKDQFSSVGSIVAEPHLPFVERLRTQFDAAAGAFCSNICCTVIFAVPIMILVGHYEDKPTMLRDGLDSRTAFPG